MKDSSKGFIIPIVLIVAGLLAIGAYFYFKNKSQGGIPDNFTTYNSSIGFSISYPEGWTVREGRGVDNILGEMELLSPGTSLKSNSYQAGDTLEHMVSVTVVADDEDSLQQVRDYYKKLIEKETSMSGGEILGQKDIKIDGQDAYEIIYETKTDNLPTKRISAFLFAKPYNNPDPLQASFNAVIYVYYMARPDVFDRKLGERIIGTLKESIWETTQKKQDEDNEEVLKSLTQRIGITLQHLRDAPAEILYDRDKSYQYLCSNGILNTEHDVNIQWIADQIIDTLVVSDQSEAGIECFSSPDKYAVSVRISGDDVVCIDRTASYKVMRGIADRVTMTCK